MADLQVMQRDLLAECEDDHVSLASVIGYVEDELSGTSYAQVRQTTLDLLYELLKSGRLQAGVPDSNGTEFHEWPFAPSAVVDKIKSLWKLDGPRPKPGEIVWFTAPSQSSSCARRQCR